MPSFKTAFPSRYLKAEDLGNTSPTVTIKSATFEDVGSGKDVERKIVLRFHELEKMLICNLTNSNSIAEIVGNEDTDIWPGHRIQLVTSRTEFQGKRVPCVRIDRPTATALSEVGF